MHKSRPPAGAQKGMLSSQRQAPQQNKVQVMNVMVKDPQVKSALDSVRTATQELHKALSDAAARRGGALKSDIEAVPQMAQAAVTSLKSSMGAQNEAAKKQITEAITHLEATQKHAAEGLKSSGQAFHNSVSKALSDARAAALKISEAVAATRSAQAKK